MLYKKLFLLFTLIITIYSCNVDNDQRDFSIEILPIESVNLSEEFIFGNTHEISMTYTRPTGCYVFNNFIIQSNSTTRTIAIADSVFSDGNCSQQSQEVTISFDFLATSNEPYIFQFFQGQDENGEDQFLIIEVPVIL